MIRPRIVIAGTSSGVGKTTVATGLMAALHKSGLSVQGFKVGPDYIDPSFHTAVTGRISRNLDLWMLPEDTLLTIFTRASTGAQISVIEGVMGLFDGSLGTDSWSTSTAAVARLLEAPVILVLDVRAMAQSAAAVVLGYRDLDPGIRLGGVILNRVGSPDHYSLLCQTIETRTGVPVLGCLGRDAHFNRPERHLGLIPAGEVLPLAPWTSKLAAAIRETVSMDKVLALAASAPPLPESSAGKGEMVAGRQKIPSVPVAVARDRAFNFYYEDSLQALTAQGAELLPFSPLEDHEIPAQAAGLILGGGFPEVFAKDLAANRRMLLSIRRAAGFGLPIYAECGGFLYLCRELVDLNGTRHTLAGLLPACGVMQPRLAGMGYRTGTVLSDNPVWQRGEVIRGHEFHYARIEEPPRHPAYRLVTTRGGESLDGFSLPGLLASFLHVHLAALPRGAARFVAACRRHMAP